MRLRLIASAVLLMLVCTGAFAQGGKNSTGQAQGAQGAPQATQGAQAAQAAQGPFSTYDKFAYARIKTILVTSAEKMPEENYNFKPTDAVRSYGQIVGHLADAQYNFCAIALGEKNPGLKIEETKKTKTDLVAALKEAVSYCDKAYETMTDASGAEMIQLMGTQMPRFASLNINNIHNMEHYGNLVTYMRLKNIVPPTTEQAQAAQQQKK